MTRVGEKTERRANDRRWLHWLGSAERVLLLLSIIIVICQMILLAENTRINKRLTHLESIVSKALEWK